MNKVFEDIKQSAVVPAMWVLTMWVVHVFFHITQADKSAYAVLPREIVGLWGVLTSPFLHANLQHLISNSLPLLVLMTGVIYFYRQVAAQTILLIFILSQILVWFFARGFYHLGASGIVYSLFGFVLGMGFFQRNIKSVVLALLVIAFYGGAIWGILPGQEGVSWESHFAGFASGLFVAFLFRNDIEPDDDPDSNGASFTIRHQPHDINSLDRDYFLPRNTFAGLRPKYTPQEPEEWRYYEEIFKKNYLQDDDE